MEDKLEALTKVSWCFGITWIGSDAIPWEAQINDYQADGTSQTPEEALDNAISDFAELQALQLSHPDEWHAIWSARKEAQDLCSLPS